MQSKTAETAYYTLRKHANEIQFDIFFYPLFNGKMHSADKIVESENISANTTRQVVLKLNFSREKKTIVFRQTLYSATEDLTSE